MAHNAWNAGRWQAFMNLGVNDPSTTPIGDGSLLTDIQITSNANEEIRVEFQESLTLTCAPCAPPAELSV